MSECRVVGTLLNVWVLTYLPTYLCLPFIILGGLKWQVQPLRSPLITDYSNSTLEDSKTFDPSYTCKEQILHNPPLTNFHHVVCSSLYLLLLFDSCRRHRQHKIDCNSQHQIKRSERVLLASVWENRLWYQIRKERFIGQL